MLALGNASVDDKATRIIVNVNCGERPAVSFETQYTYSVQNAVEFIFGKILKLSPRIIIADSLKDLQKLLNKITQMSKQNGQNTKKRK